MNPAIGLAVTIRVRVGASAAYQPSGLVDASRVLALFTDVASELMIRLDGDEGMLRGFQQVDMLAPVFVGDFIEATGAITKLTSSTRQIAFEARKVVSYLRSPSAAVSAADALVSPIVVCRALGTSVVHRALQRRPRLVLPSLPPLPADAAKLPAGNVVVTPPPHVVITPPRETPPEIIVGASIVGGGVTRNHTPHIPVSPEEVAAEACRCRDAGASVIFLNAGGVAAEQEQAVEVLRSYVEAIRAAADLVIIVSPVVPGASSGALGTALASAGSELVSICAGSFNYGDTVVQMTRSAIRDFVSSRHEQGQHTLMECYELGHIDEVLSLGRDRLLPSPLRLQVVFGVPGAMGATEETIRFVASHMPRNCWFASGVGRYQRRVTELSVRLGGNVRVGLADNMYQRRGVLAETSALFVDKISSFARTVGRQPVDAARARVLLGLVADLEPVSPSSPPELGEVEEPAGEQSAEGQPSALKEEPES